MTPKTNDSYFLYNVRHHPKIATPSTVVLKDYANPNLAPSHVCHHLRSISHPTVRPPPLRKSLHRPRTVLTDIQRRRTPDVGQL